MAIQEEKNSAKISLRNIHSFNKTAFLLEYQHVADIDMLAERANVIADLYRKLQPEDLDLFPENICRNLNGILRTFNQDIYTKIQNGLPAGSDLPTYLDTIEGNHFHGIIPFLTYLEVLGPELHNKNASKNAKKIEMLEYKSRKAYDAIVKLSIDKGVSKNAASFQKVADNNFWLTWVWILIMLLCASLSIFIVFCFGAQDLKKTEITLEGINLAINKAILLGVALYGINFCGKGAIGAQHNAVVNRHRQNALESYEAILVGIEDPEERKIVLQQIVNCIFSHQSTGYAQSQNQSDVDTGTIKVIADAISSAAKSKGAS